MQDGSVAYWKAQLDGAPVVIELPTDHPRPAAPQYRGGSKIHQLSSDLSRRLASTAEAEGGAVEIALLAGLLVLLSRYSGQEDIVVGSPVLPIRTDLSGDPTVLQLLAEVGRAVQDGRAHPEFPLEKIAAELQLPQSCAYHPIFQVTFGLDGTAAASAFDMSWSVSKAAQGLSVRVDYDATLFDEATIGRALLHYEKLLEGIDRLPENHISELPMLGEEERQQILTGFNATDADYPSNVVLHDFVARQAEASPDAVAVIWGRERLTYRELNSRANRIAHYLRKHGAGPDVLVGIYCRRSTEMLLCILGVLKAGSAYVPLDPNYPQERIGNILEDAKAPIVLSQKPLVADLPAFAGKRICVDADWPEISLEPDSNPATEVTPRHLAYVLFTSGSTGRPKGVAIEHRSSATFVQWARGVFSPEDLAGVLLSTSICFDLSIFEIFVTWSAGGAVIVAENALYLSGLPAKNEVTLINTVPSAMAELVRMESVPRSVRVANLAGEALRDVLVAEIYERTTVQRVYNLYGPTEDTTYSTYTLCPRGAPVTIGRPIANSQAYIVDKRLNPVPIGVPGELYLAGAGLARGYYGRPDLTAERFVSNPFRGEAGARMYRTGDLCRWLPNGDIQYLGRIDHQVKLRGFRIELGEIEATLDKHPLVRQAIVMAREDEPGNQRLVAYILATPGAKPSEEEIVEHVKRSLPDYMAPSAVVVLEAFPLTPNGKVNRRALPAPQHSRTEIVGYVAPRTATEKALAEIWSEELRLPQVGIRDNFFSLGGHSLMAARVFQKISRTLRKDLPISTLFRAPTIEQLATYIQPAEAKDDYPTIIVIKPGGSKPPFFCVHGGAGSTLFFHTLASRLDDDQPFYGIEPEGLDGRPFKRPTIEQMAAHYLAEIRRIQPAGPYYLGGYCFGGVVAFEMARQLQACGETVALNALLYAQLAFNHYALPPRPAAPAGVAVRSPRQKLSRFFSAPGRSLAWRWKVLQERRIQLKIRFRHKSARVVYRLIHAAGMRIPPAMRTRYIVHTLMHSEEIYVPKPYAGKLALFWGAGPCEFGPNLGWDGLATELEQHIIPGGRNGRLEDRRILMNEPRMAEELNACLRSAQTQMRETVEKES